MLLIKAVAFKLKGSISEALSTLCKAIEIAEPKGYFRIFIDEGEKIEELLKQCLQKNLSSRNAYIKELLNEFNKNKLKQSNINLIDELSKRELDVLNLLSKDFSTQEISNELFISLNTVKTHVKNIFSKLEAKSRTEAVNIAKENEIL